MTKIILICAVVMFAFTGCTKKSGLPADLPEVSDANCTPEAIKKLDGAYLQQQFGDQCVRRGTYQKSVPKAY